MKIKRLVIENFKSIERIELVEPNPFTVFVGPNGSGKSNIFEALEFHIAESYNLNALRLFGGVDYLQNRQLASTKYSFNVVSDLFFQTTGSSYLKIKELDNPNPVGPHLVFGTHYQFIESEGKYVAYSDSDMSTIDQETNDKNYKRFIEKFSRIFVRNERLQKQNYIDNSRLNLSCSNLEKVLRRILIDSVLRNEISEWLELFVPGFKAVEVDDHNELHWFEQSSSDYFTKDLISDGTYNILALLTAVYQSDDTPQFLCIEEPENGLHPQVAGELVDFFRIMCEERGHYIWLNTHSQSMARRVKPEEFVIVEKVQGATTARQFKESDFHGMRADEAWLTNALNGGLAW